MKLILTTIAAATVATSALAGASDRYTDLRFDSAIGHVTDDSVAVDATPKTAMVSLSSRNASKSGKGYAYTNPYGVGPYNDSR